MGGLGGFFKAFGHAAVGGLPGTRERIQNDAAEYAQQQKEDQDAREFADYVRTSGALAVHPDGNSVQRSTTLPDGTVIPNAYIDKAGADGRQIISHGKGRNKVQYELPTPEEQIGLHAARLDKAYNDPAAVDLRNRQQTDTANQAGRTAGATALGAGQAKNDLDEQQRQRIGIPMPQDIADALGADPTIPGSGLSSAAPLTDAATPSGSSTDTLPVMGAGAQNPVPPKRRLLLPDELDKMATAAGKYVDYQSKADARQNPADKPQKVHTVTPSADGKTEIITYDDGSIEEKPLQAGVKPTESDTEISLSKDVARAQMPGATQAMKDKGRESELTLKRLDQSKVAARPVSVTNMAVPGSADAPSTSAQLVGRYGMDFNRALPYRASQQQRDDFLKQVQAVNPQFKAENYPIYQKTEQDAITGKIGQQSGSLGTMVGHLGVLQEAAKDLKNGNLTAINQLANGIGAATGNDAVTVYKTIVHRLGPEVTKAYVAGGGSAGERGTNEEDFDVNLGPEQIQRNIGISGVLAESLIKSLEKRHNDGTFGQSSLKMLDDEHRQILDHLKGSAPANLRGAGGAAAVVPANVKAVLSSSGVGPGVHTLSDGSKWMKAADGTITKQ